MNRITEQPLTFQTKSTLLSDNSVGGLLPESRDAQPSTCVDAEPYALQVLDDSMAPEFWQGCIILIDPTGRVTDGSYVLAKTVEPNDINSTGEQGQENGSAQNTQLEPYVFRQLRREVDGQWTLNALNEHYLAINTDEQFNNIVGVIVQRAGKRRHQHKRYD